MAAKSSIVLLSLAALGACGGSGSSGGIEPPVNTTTVNTSPLVGQWESLACTADGGFSERVTLAYNADFTGDRILYTHTGDNCDEPGFEITIPNTYREGSSAELPGRGLQTQLDIFQEAPFLTIRAQAAANAFNLGAFCNFTEWQINVSYDIEGCAIGNREAIVPRPQYTVYLIEDNEFLFGGAELSFTADNRPTTLDARPAFRRAGVLAEPELSVFPPEVRGLWALENTDFYIDFDNEGVWTSYVPDESGLCHSVNTIVLTSVGNDRYETTTGSGVGIVPQGGQLRFTFDGAATVFVLEPANREELSVLTFCEDL